jgi:hypothetical protein
MASILSPYGLKPINLIGGQAFNGGVIRDIKLSTNNTEEFYTGDVIQLTAAGNPQALGATITTGTTVGVIGVCLGVSYVDPNLKYQIFSQYLPADAITGGYTNVFIRVCDDPDQLFQIQGSEAFGSLTNGANGAIGKNADLGNFGGNDTTGLSTINLVVGTDGGSLADTATLAMRVVDVVAESASDAFPDLIVKFNEGAHSYNFATGV